MRNNIRTSVVIFECIALAGMAGFVLLLQAAIPLPARAQVGIGIYGVGGRLAPASLPPYGDGDVLNFPFTCSPEVTIVGPEGTNWGVYQWGVATPYDEWEESYLTNGYPYTHADEYMLGTAIFPNPNPLCPLPLLTSIGTSLYKAIISY